MTGTVNPAAPRATALTGDDHAGWRRLFEGYAVFYGVAMSDAIADRVWAWLMAPDHVLEGLIVHDADRRALGLLHYRACPRPLAGADMGFADDLFVVPEARGTGVADALFAELQTIAGARGWPVVRWITQDHHTRGRALYDRMTGGASDFIMYQWRMNDAR